MQLAIALLSLPRIACFALGDTPKARFWGNLLGFLGCPLWLFSEGVHGQWGMAAASAGGMLLYGWGMWRLVRPVPRDPLVVDALSDEEALDAAMDRAEGQA
jgi:hypothetical protein